MVNDSVLTYTTGDPCDYNLYTCMHDILNRSMARLYKGW
jgi:hypothetical protein